MITLLDVQSVREPASASVPILSGSYPIGIFTRKTTVSEK